MFVLPACSRTTTSPDHTGGVTKTHSWSGRRSQGYYSPIGQPGPNDFSRTITDTTFSVVKISNDLVQIPFLSCLLRYRGTDPTTHAMTFDSSFSIYIGAPPALVYHPDQNSIFISYEIVAPGGSFGMDDPYLEYLSLHTQH